MFGRKKTTAQKIAAKKTNFAGVRMDRLDKAGNLPFGWVVHNKKTVDAIEAELQPIRKAICDAETDAEKLEALKRYEAYLKQGIVKYRRMGACEGKYFECDICGSEETKKRLKELKELRG